MKATSFATGWRAAETFFPQPPDKTQLTQTQSIHNNDPKTTTDCVTSAKDCKGTRIATVWPQKQSAL